MNKKKQLKKLTQRQKEILDYLIDSLNKYGFLPSIREICKYIGLSSPSTVHSHLKSLEKMGFIKRYSSKSRAIEISNMNLKEVCFVPVLEEENILIKHKDLQRYADFFPLSAEFTDRNETFLYIIKNTALKKYSILPGDLLIISKKNNHVDSNADKADIEIFLLEKNGKILFKELNSIKNPENCKIIGKISGLIRKINQPLLEI